MPVKYKLGRRGSLTVEAAVVVPTVIFCILALIYMCLFLYQYVYLQSVADRAAERGAVIWNSPKKDMFIAQMTKEYMEDRDTYWRFIDLKKARKKEKISKYINFEVNKYSALSALNKENAKNPPKVDEPELVDYIIYKKLKVTVTDNYKLPTGKLLAPFGFGEYFTIKASAEAVVNEPVEFIRNTDFVIDVGKEIDDKTGGNAEKLGNNLKDAFGNIMKKLDTFLEKSKYEESVNTGNGFLGGKNKTIPEYVYLSDDQTLASKNKYRESIPKGAKIYKINGKGEQIPVAYFDGEEWVRIVSAGP